MTDNKVFRDGKLHVQESKCSTCIYRPGNLMDLRPGQKDTLQTEAVANGGVIPCHQTIEASGNEAGRESVCRGFFDVTKHEGTGLLAVAERLGVIEFTPPADKR